MQGNIKGIRSLVEPLQIAMDNGAKRALIPLENKRSFLEVTGDVMEQGALGRAEASGERPRPFSARQHVLPRGGLLCRSGQRRSAAHGLASRDAFVEAATLMP